MGKSQKFILALAGNPNVGKSTLFNNLTGMRQHTGNWTGKTVTTAKGYCRRNNTQFELVDLPGTYSLTAQSAEEEAARDYIIFGDYDAVIVVCDATCLERNLNLALQIIEITDNVIVCVNLMDEAKHKGIEIDLPKLSQMLGVPVVGAIARKKKTLNELLEKAAALTSGEKAENFIKYGSCVKEAVETIKPALNKINLKNLKIDWLCIKLLENDAKLLDALGNYLGYDFFADNDLSQALKKARSLIDENGQTWQDFIAFETVNTAERICKSAVKFTKQNYDKKDRAIDRIVTNKLTGVPIMVALLALIIWLTIAGANYPSKLLSSALFWIEGKLLHLIMSLGAPVWLSEMLVLGVYRVTAWVVSVMLPPMAIFFPLFTFLEDLGYLPRIAFNLDKYFKKCSACGKQALTMCMGLGCNAVGVSGCKIIDSPRERLIAILTNSFMPCNGRFPTLIALISMFFAVGASGLMASAVSALILTAFMVFSVVMTFWVSKALSKTVLKGLPSSFILELPPYRKPQIGKIFVRSVFDRTLYILARAVAVAAPTGLIIWLMSNVTINNQTPLAVVSNALEPFAYLMGLDGVILTAFLLAFPANEILIPVIIMAYISGGSITDAQNIAQVKEIFVSNGWTPLTALCVMIFCLFHWPCGTTCLTIKKETKSLKWTALSVLIPTAVGILLCITAASTARFIFG